MGALLSSCGGTNSNHRQPQSQPQTQPSPSTKFYDAINSGSSHTEGNDSPNQPRNKNTKESNLLDDRNGRNSKVTTRSNKNNNSSHTQNNVKLNTDKSSPQTLPALKKARATSQLPPGKDRTDKYPKTVTPMDSKGTTNLNKASEDKMEYEPSQPSSQKLDNLMPKTHSDSKHKQTKNKKEGTAALHGIESEDREQKTVSQDNQHLEKKTYSNPFENKNERPINSNNQQLLQNQSTEFMDNQPLDEMEKDLNEVAKHDQMEHVTRFDDRNKGPYRSYDNLNTKKPFPIKQRPFSMDNHFSDDVKKDSLGMSKNVQVYNSRSTKNVQNEHNDNRTETIDSQTVRKSAYSKDDHSSYEFCGQDEHKFNFDQNFNSKNEKETRFDKETLQSTKASRNLAPHEEQNQPVEVSEQPLQILDVHQYFQDDLDLNSLDSLGNGDKIKQIASYAQTFESTVSEFSEERYSLQYFVLDEKLMRLIEKLDRIKCQNDTVLTEKKVQVIEYIKSLHTTLDKRARDY